MQYCTCETVDSLLMLTRALQAHMKIQKRKEEEEEEEKVRRSIRMTKKINNNNIAIEE